MQVRSLAFATDIDVLPSSAIVEDRGEFIVVRTPSNPSHYWGNFLLFRDAPRHGDRSRWENAFDTEFGPDPQSAHRAFCWDRPDGERGAAESEFLEAGYQGTEDVGLIATPDQLLAHARASAHVKIRQLALDGDEELWDAVVEMQVDNRDAGHEEEFHRAFVRARIRDQRELFANGRGGWFAAITREGEVAANCGVVVTGGRARYQAVNTAERFRRQGIARRLVNEVGRAAVDRFGAQHLVIVADADYHAFELYKSLGFIERERMFSVCWWPGAPNAHAHPTFGTTA